ncbi:MAG: hypothetical protein ACLT1K_07845 [[Clostridium] leptum]
MWGFTLCLNCGATNSEILSPDRLPYDVWVVSQYLFRGVFMTVHHGMWLGGIPAWGTVGGIAAAKVGYEYSLPRFPRKLIKDKGRSGWGSGESVADQA